MDAQDKITAMLDAGDSDDEVLEFVNQVMGDWHEDNPVEEDDDGETA